MHKRVRPALALAATLAAVTLTAPAASAAPKVPDGCTFDPAAGLTTCTATTTTATTIRDYPEAGTIPDGSGASYLCLKYAKLPSQPNIVPTTYSVSDPDGPYLTKITAERSTTTKTTYQGVSAGKGNKPVTTTTSTATTYRLTNGYLLCDDPDDATHSLVYSGVGYLYYAKAGGFFVTVPD